MGIQGLLPFVQKCSRKVEMSEFSGCTVAVDVYCWLHKGAFSCAEKLARGEDTDQYVQYCMKYVNMLLSYNIKPILVFDGCHLPAKAETEKTRRERREYTKKKACELLRTEKTDEARQLLRRCVDITHPMAHKLITRARAANIDCIVAPFEADAQLAYLNISGMAHCVVTEDSDLLLFGCTKVIFKLDVGGSGLLVEQEMLPVAMKMRPEEFTLDKFRQMCVLSGCDYLSSLPGIGLYKACKFVKLTSQPDISKILHKIGSYLNMPNLVVPEDYKYKFVNAMGMFRHQPAFDPVKRCVVPLTPIEDGSEVVLPKAHPPDVALQLALGNIDPITMKVVDKWNPDIVDFKEFSKQRSIWAKHYIKPSALPPPRAPKTLPAVKSTFGKQFSVNTDEIAVLAKENSKSEEDELEEMRGAWGISKKRKLDQLEHADQSDHSMDAVVEPSPPRPNPFKTGVQGNVQLTGSTTLSRLTSPPQIQSKFLSSQKSSMSQTNSSPNVPLMISRYFASPLLSTEKIESHFSDTPKVVPESPSKPQPSPERESPKMKKRNIFLISPSSASKADELSTCDMVVDAETKNCKKRKSLLSAMEYENETMYKNKESIEKITVKQSGLSSFKWKPLNATENLLPKSEPSATDKVSSAVRDLVLDTPPNSQESDVMTMPKLPSYLEPARSIGLSKNKSPAMQTFLSKFKFEPKTKLKTK